MATKEEMAKDMAYWFDDMKERIISVSFPSCEKDYIKFRGEHATCSHMVKWSLPIVMLDKSMHPMPSADLLCREIEEIRQDGVFCFLRQDETIRLYGSFMFVVLPEDEELRKRALFILTHLPLQKYDGQEGGVLYMIDFDNHEMPIRKLAELYDE